MTKYSDEEMLLLIGAIIKQALNDLSSKSEIERFDAKQFLMSEDCEMFCEALRMDYETTIKKIDFDKPLKTVIRDIDVPLFSTVYITIGNQSRNKKYLN
jgi:hypothetical protein